ncbi:hypothetical protein PCYB_005850 [Plasmodium cynomolgi strain B]|uniref:CYIR protein n=1 Tax=Plasmodium cynomolgi (strain B) TaxID=1120755 RepID=K6UFC0_PLACD|nr:hypothetical protein PCYB_005850 [Plasmodium cynomolgi strain B]GAB69836.1 hypothetical protein PCYB_005850 [Plasmodium cynomolgi strain B]
MVIACIMVQLRVLFLSIIHSAQKYALYNEYKENCTTSKKNVCPDFFSKCENNDPNTLLSQLKCYEHAQIEETLSENKK